MQHRLIVGDCLSVMQDLEERSVNLTFGSPPYEDCRTYGIDFKLKGQQWVDWMVEVVLKALRVTDGLVAFVVEGKTRGYKWSATPALLLADLHRAGVTVRKPPIYRRVGIPGSGGPDWLRNDYEFIVCATNGGRLPWSDNTAMGHPPVCQPGGAMNNRLQDGTKLQTRRKANGVRVRDGVYKMPAIANPGNVINCGAAGGGNIGDKVAHENEAPFPEQLAEFFVRSFCPPGGVVLDPFAGSGTVAKVCEVHGRNSINIDVRDSQIDLVRRRLDAVEALNAAS